MGLAFGGNIKGVGTSSEVAGEPLDSRGELLVVDIPKPMPAGILAQHSYRCQELAKTHLGAQTMDLLQPMKDV
jgi:hypothetical protein